MAKHSPPSIVIVAIGTELTQGHGLDTNGPWLAQQLGRAGLVVNSMVTISDERTDLFEVLRLASERNHSVVTIGGLGPTEDDRTRQVIAAYFGAELKKDKPSRNALSKRYKTPKISDSAKKQTRFPKGAVVLANEVGVAPGFAMQHGQRFVAALPGPPREFMPVVSDGLLPLLRKWYELPKERSARELTIFGVSEPDCDTRCADLLQETPDLRASILAGGGKVVLRWQALNSAGEAEAQSRFEYAKGLFGNRVVCESGGKKAIQESLVASLRAKGLKVATAESCTGGAVAQAITSVAGSSGVLEFGVVSYSNAMKTQLLGVDPAIFTDYGAVSAHCVEAMAKGALSRSGANIAVAISGIAGPDGGSEEKPVGLVYFGVATKIGEKKSFRAYPCRFRGDRERIQMFATLNALDLVRLAADAGRVPKRRDVAYFDPNFG